MNIAVLGMWHLGTVTAGCLAAAGYSVLGYDPDEGTVRALNEGELPVKEPGLEELVTAGMRKGLLRFSSIPEEISGSDILWVAYDTPVDEEDRADVDLVIDGVCSLFPHIRAGALVISSSQLPIGSVGLLEEKFRRNYPDRPVSFACLPENLRLGKAISVFTNPDRVIAGVRSEKDGKRIASLLKPFTSNIIWMSVESAEMTKHALNSFLATSVTFANELAAICEHYGADASEVEKGLKSDARIGPGAYLKAGNPFAGGTLARDLNYLLSLGQTKQIPTHLFSAVLQSNNSHKLWARRKLTEVLGNLGNRKVAVLGLTYKPGTNTLRRSESVAACRWLNEQGALVSAYDPAVKSLPEDLAEFILLAPSATEALRDAHAVVIATEWPQFRAITCDDILGYMALPEVFDPGRFLDSSLRSDKRIHYLSVGSLT
ncbi:MAG: nucleotide sugar dehydrogenase [Syntrophobacteraceae bacterium]|jgi:UDPglucose 6-dehydrogenase